MNAIKIISMHCDCSCFRFKKKKKNRIDTILESPWFKHSLHNVYTTVFCFFLVKYFKILSADGSSNQRHRVYFFEYGVTRLIHNDKNNFYASIGFQAWKKKKKKSMRFLRRPIASLFFSRSRAKYSNACLYIQTAHFSRTARRNQDGAVIVRLVSVSSRKS